MNSPYVPPHRREEAPAPVPVPGKGKGRGIVPNHTGTKGGRGKGRGYRKPSTNPDLADVRQPSGSWDSVSEGNQVATNFRTFVKQPIVSTREEVLLQAVDTAAQYLLRQQHDKNISLTHMRAKLVLGEIAYKRYAKPAKRTREELCKQLLQGGDRKQTEFRTTLLPNNVSGVVEYFEKMGFVKQTPTDNIEKQRRWQIYLRMKKRRSHIAYVSHDGHNIKIRKLLVAEESSGYIKIDVFDNCGPPPQDWRLRLERHPLSNSDDDEAVRKWILEEVVVNAAGNLCPPLNVSDISYDCIRRKYKSPDPSVPKTQCTGIWKRGSLKLQIQYVEQTVSESFRGETNPGYELHISHEKLTEALHQTRWVERMSVPLNIYKLSVLLAELLLPVFDIEDRLANSDLAQKVFATIEENPIPLPCALLGVNYCEERGRHVIESEEQPFFEPLRQDLNKARQEDQIRFTKTRPCNANWLTEGNINKHNLTYSCLGETAGKIVCSQEYKYPLETSIYFECRIFHLRNDGAAKVGWQTPDGRITHSFSELGSGAVIGTQLDLLSGQILFWINADQVPLTPEYDFYDNTHLLRDHKYQPFIELLNSSAELMLEIEPLQEGFSREPTPLLCQDVYSNDVMVEAAPNPYDQEEDSDNADYPYVTAPREALAGDDNNEEFSLPRENFIAFENLSKPWTQIGVGGFGAVYKCCHREYSDDVAIKELKTCSTAQARRKFQKEIINLMKVSKYGKLLLCTGWSESQSGTLYMITEYCSEGSLTNKLKNMENCDIKERVAVALEVGISIAQALTHLHSNLLNYVHLDVAARNVLIQRGACYKLGDMGLLALEGTPCPVICIPWSPPEMVLINSAERRATKPHDCWSFGCLLYEIITGREPYWHIRGIYGGETTPVKTYMSGDKILPLRPEDVPPVLSSIWNYLEKFLWHLDPQMRPKMHEVVVKLQDLRKEIQVSFHVFAEENTSPHQVVSSSDFHAHTAEAPAPPSVTANPSHFMSVSAAPPKPKPKAKTFRKRGKN
eukprot:TRINITY_DN13497_c0_g1_i1.p1 TRINITY_DN13497_c0_g1~~TRINITY_DN13497_c0_g1_i1.p1  ORF type:complete len:1018 (+),score=120.44 TRINITY_DN13497_c0_g1_i1:77-3130(+)